MTYALPARRTAALATLAAVAAAAALAARPAHAAEPEPAASRPAAAAPLGLNEAAAACEKAARQSITAQVERASDIVFSGAPERDAALSSEQQLVLRGSGRWRDGDGPRSFRYSCNVDRRNAEAVGLVLRDTSPARPEPATARADPDIGQLSPTACEASAAGMLQKRWPGVTQIRFDPATRRLVQGSEATTELSGQGRAMRTPGGPMSLFRFSCEVDPRSGQILGLRVSD